MIKTRIVIVVLILLMSAPVLRASEHSEAQPGPMLNIWSRQIWSRQWPILNDIFKPEFRLSQPSSFYRLSAGFGYYLLSTFRSSEYEPGPWHGERQYLLEAREVGLYVSLTNFQIKPFPVRYEDVLYTGLTIKF